MNLCRLTLSDLEANATQKALYFPEKELEKIRNRLDTIEEKSK